VAEVVKALLLSLGIVMFLLAFAALAMRFACAAFGWRLQDQPAGLLPTVRSAIAVEVALGLFGYFVARAAYFMA
jgi:hypothetical protein